MCPFCKNISLVEYDIQTEYSLLPLLRCSNEKCFAVSILEIETCKILSEEEVINKFQLDINKIEKIKNIENSFYNLKNRKITRYFCTIKLAKILKISNDDCVKYKIEKDFDITNILIKYFIKPIAQIINDNIQFSESDTRELISSKSCDKIKKIYNITETSDEIDENTKVDWRISLDVNSYNVENPENTYPDNLFYGENYTFLLYCNNKGQELQTCYWDD